MKITNREKDIMTRIQYGKKQFVFEYMNKDLKEDNHSVNSQNSNDERCKTIISIKFSDIEELEINLNDSNLTILTKVQPKEQKEYKQQYMYQCIDQHKEKQPVHLGGFPGREQVL